LPHPNPLHQVERELPLRQRNFIKDYAVNYSKPIYLVSSVCWVR
jgi:hypothetical protein